MLLAAAVLFPLIEFDNGSVGLPTVKDYYLESVLGTHGNIVKLIPSILAGFFISSEYSMGTMKSIVSSGNSRVKIYFAKLLIFSIGTIMISLILPIFMTGASAIYFGFHVPAFEGPSQVEAPPLPGKKEEILPLKTAYTEILILSGVRSQKLEGIQNPEFRIQNKRRYLKFLS